MALRHALAAVVPRGLALSRAAAPSVTRGMAGEGLKGFHEAEKTMEDMYFTKEDQRIMNKLLAKVKAQSDKVDTHAAAGVQAAELSALKPLSDKYKISADDINKLLAWKHTHY